MGHAATGIVWRPSRFGPGGVVSSAGIVSGPPVPSLTRIASRSSSSSPFFTSPRSGGHSRSRSSLVLNRDKGRAKSIHRSHCGWLVHKLGSSSRLCFGGTWGAVSLFRFTCFALQLVSRQACFAQLVSLHGVRGSVFRVNACFASVVARQLFRFSLFRFSLFASACFASTCFASSWFRSTEDAGGVCGPAACA